MIEQLKDKYLALSMLTLAMGCKGRVVGEILDKIYNFKIWFKRDVTMARTMAEEDAIGALALLNRHSNNEEDVRV